MLIITTIIALNALFFAINNNTRHYTNNIIIANPLLSEVEIMAILNKLPCKSVNDYASYVIDYYSFLMPANPFDPCTTKQLFEEIANNCNLTEKTLFDLSVLALLPGDSLARN